MRRYLISIALSAFLILGILLCQSFTSPSAAAPHQWSSSSSPVSLPLMSLTTLNITPVQAPPNPTPDSVFRQRVHDSWIASVAAADDAQAQEAHDVAIAAQQQATLQQEQSATISSPTPPQTAPTSTLVPSDAAAWQAVAICEEGGNDDPYAGYYGILEWNGFDGYATAGAAPQSVQLQWEQQNVGAPPDESGGCHSY